MEWNELIEDFILELEILGRAQNTIKNYRSKLNHYANYFKSMGVKPFDLTKKDVNDYLLSLINTNYQNSTINITMSRLKKLFDYAVDQEYIETNPIKYKNRPVTSKIIHVLNNSEVKQLLKAVKNHTPYPLINQRDYVIFLMLIDCGLRISEIEHLNNEDILDNQLMIKNSKFNKDRVLGISPILKKEINKYARMKEKYYKEKLIEQEAFFISYQHGRMNAKTLWYTMNQVKSKLDIRSNIRFSPHTLRHTYAHMQIRNGIDIYTLSLNMGHYDVSMTQKYLRTIRSEDFVDKSIAKSNLMHLR